MKEDNYTDITIELFNFCRGTCTGCMLSAQERKESEPSIALDDFTVAMRRLADYGRQKKIPYRTILTFGDTIWMPHETLKRYLDASVSNGHRLGCTMTLVDDRMEHYREALKILNAADPNVIYDITLDPVRMLKHDDYCERIREAINRAPHVHLQVLLSEAVIDMFSPEDLSSLIIDKTGGHPAVLGFAPSLSNIDSRNYRYNVTSAADYALRYYHANEQSEDLLNADLRRFAEDAVGQYEDFMRQSFHIGHDMKLYSTSYTVFGDVIHDYRNNGRALGDLRKQSIEECMSDVRIKTVSAMNAAFMQSDQLFGCENCDFLKSCTFQGVGIARKMYAGFEAKTGSCYGPRDFLRSTTRIPKTRRIIPIVRRANLEA